MLFSFSEKDTLKDTFLSYTLVFCLFFKLTKKKKKFLSIHNDKNVKNYKKNVPLHKIHKSMIFSAYMFRNILNLTNLHLCI